MEPTIGRSIKHGFLTTNKSWAGIGVFAGSWIVVAVLAIVGLALTNPPPELFEERPTANLIAPATAPVATDAAAKNTTAPTVSDTSVSPTAAARDAVKEEAARRDRVIGQWLGHAWPVLLLCFLWVVGASVWLTGAQAGYLVQRVKTNAAALSDFWASGARNFVPLLGAWALWLAFFMGGILVAVLILSGLTLFAKIVPGWVSTVLGAIAVVAIITVAVWFFVRLSFWFVAVVADRVGPVAGLKQSFRVTKGRWWLVAGLGLLVTLISYGLWLPCGLLEWFGSLAGGPVGMLLGLLGTLGAVFASLYVGFAALTAYIRFYEDAKVPATLEAAPIGS